MPNDALARTQVSLTIDLRVAALMLKIFVRGIRIAQLSPLETIQAQRGIDLLREICLRTGYMTELELREVYDQLNLWIGRQP